MTTFGTLHPDGSLTDVRIIPQSAMRLCLHCIMVPEHYRADNSCRCDDKSHKVMKTWGYRWNGRRWW